MMICPSRLFLFLQSSVKIDTFHEIALEEAMVSQPYLIAPESLPPRIRYERLFEVLPQLVWEHTNGPGRHPLSRHALLRAMVYKSLRRLRSLSDLTFDLSTNPALSAAVGFGPEGRLPSVERLSAFMRDTPNEQLQTVREQLVAALQHQGVVTGELLSVDSAPIIAPLRENNLKTSLRRKRFDKTQPPKGDPEAGVGIICHYPTPEKKEVSWFWGYRNHVLTDAHTELPVWESTHPANVSDLPPGRDALRWAKTFFGSAVKAVAADAEYDSEDLLTFIAKDMLAMPVVPRNPRNEQATEHTVRGQAIYCAANLPMSHRGRMTDRKTGIQYRIYSCPLHWRSKVRQAHLLCPANHPKFLSQKGCNVLIRLTPSIRSQIAYGSAAFAQVYNQRTSAERVFSRLLSVTCQEPTVRGLNATRNHVTIAHIAVLLVAAAAHRDGQNDKLRFVRSYAPNFIT